MTERQTARVGDVDVTLIRSLRQKPQVAYHQTIFRIVVVDKGGRISVQKCTEYDFVPFFCLTIQRKICPFGIKLFYTHIYNIYIYYMRLFLILYIISIYVCYNNYTVIRTNKNSRVFERLSQLFPKRVPIAEKFRYMRPNRVIILDSILRRFYPIVITMNE